MGSGDQPDSHDNLIELVGSPETRFLDLFSQQQLQARYYFFFSKKYQLYTVYPVLYRFWRGTRPCNILFIIGFSFLSNTNCITQVIKLDPFDTFSNVSETPIIILDAFDSETFANFFFKKFGIWN